MSLDLPDEILDDDEDMVVPEDVPPLKNPIEIPPSPDEDEPEA